MKNTFSNNKPPTVTMEELKARVEAIKKEFEPKPLPDGWQVIESSFLPPNCIALVSSKEFLIYDCETKKGYKIPKEEFAAWLAEENRTWKEDFIKRLDTAFGEAERKLFTRSLDITHREEVR